ncbi:MAG: GyrI-like domain-containing protein [Anaerolineales bacterium]
MRPKIINKKAFPVIGMGIQTTSEGGKNFQDIPLFWQKATEENLIERIPHKKHPRSYMGICMDFEPNGGFTYLIASEVTHTEDIPEGMICREIPPATYAVFTAHGKMPDAIQETTKYIYQDWLPDSKYQHAGTPDFELYDKRSTVGGENAEVDIYIPIGPP